ncbi:VWA domain-containing protein [Enterobacter hormaechei]|nr:VWA domain-containing protein [Enterobacter hormaechei]
MAKNVDNTVASTTTDAQTTLNPALTTSGKAAQAEYGDGSVALDLVIVIDTSRSMSDEAAALSGKIDATIAAATKKCPSKLRVTYLGIQGTWPGTKFDQSASDYLLSHGAKSGDLQARAPFKEPDGKDHSGNKEDLCRAVIDICNHFDWRENAMRSIFVLGDEGMDGGGGVLTDTAKAKNDEAIEAARNKVRVYTYQGTPDQNSEDMYPTLADMDAITKEYERLATETYGRSYIYTTGFPDFELVLEQILCHSLEPLPSDQPDTHTSSCGSVCDQLPAIISSVNTLADIMNKAIDACCGASVGGKQPNKSDCGCGGKKNP